VLYFGVRSWGSAVSDRSLLPTQIDLRPLAEAELPLEREFSPEQVMGHAGGSGARPDSGTGTASDDEFTVIGPVTFAGSLTRAGDRFHLRGRIGATLQLMCGRCLTSVPQRVDTPVDLTYVPDKPPAGTAAKDVKAASGDEDVELQDEDLNTSYYRDHVLDLGEMLREQFYLALPMQPLCRPDCKGLCPQCGVDRNVEQCACQSEWVDPRLSGLKALVTRKPE
jgi:uncharacterized protein